MPFELNSLLAMGAPAEGAQSNPIIGMAPFILIFIVFYFLLIAPARKKQKQHGEMIEALKNGDKVVTSGGIFGTVVGVSDRTFQLRIADGVKIEVAKNAISGLDNPQE